MAEKIILTSEETETGRPGPETTPAAPSETTPKTPPTPPVERATGATTRIQILALGTWAHVQIDGREVGQTPYNGTVVVGAHTIELITDDGRRFSARQTATEGTLLRVTHRFE